MSNKHCIQELSHKITNYLRLSILGNTRKIREYQESFKTSYSYSLVPGPASKRKFFSVLAKIRSVHKNLSSSFIRDFMVLYVPGRVLLKSVSANIWDIPNRIADLKGSLSNVFHKSFIISSNLTKNHRMKSIGTQKRRESFEQDKLFHKC